MADASKTAAILIAGLGKGPKRGGMPMPDMGMKRKMMEEEEPDLSSYALKSAAGDLMSALKSGDVQAVAEALKASHTACGMGMDSEEEDL